MRAECGRAEVRGRPIIADVAGVAGFKSSLVR
jgi:hypothetical protein